MLTKICILIAILLIAMEGKGENVKTPNEYQDIQMMEEEKEATDNSKKPPPKEGGGTGKKPIEQAVYEKVYNVNSCDELKKNDPTLKSGNYKLRIGGKDVAVYCHMGELCGTVGGWTRLGHLKMSSASKKCPNEQFSYINKGELHLCRIKSDKMGCATASYSSHGIKYSTICGYARGYQKGQTQAFNNYRSPYGNYLDGVGIIRYNKSTRKENHVWSYASGRNEKSQGSSACPCNKGASKKSEPPSFVGSNYYCESGTSINYPGVGRFYSQDPLWDGKGFNNRERPCRKGMMPYFKRTYGSATTDYIIVKLCRTGAKRVRDVYLKGYGVFVK